MRRNGTRVALRRLGMNVAVRRLGMRVAVNCQVSLKFELTQLVLQVAVFSQPQTCWTTESPMVSLFKRGD